MNGVDVRVLRVPVGWAPRMLSSAVIRGGSPRHLR